MSLDNLKKRIANIKQASISYDELVEKTEQLKQQNEAQQRFLSHIFLNYTLEPMPFVKSVKNLSYELLRFVDNVCIKYDLSWWLDYGTLLGAVRHADFIPWDDDLDSGMMRADYNKFVDIIDDEISDNGLTNIKTNFKIQHPERKPQYRWIQVKYKIPNVKYSLAGLDILPYDYLKDYPREGVSEAFHKSRRKFYRDGRKGKDINKMLKRFYDDVGLTFERQDHFIGGAECVRGNTNRFNFKILKTDDLFPLKRIPFGIYDFPVPCNTHKFLKDIYGKNYGQIPNDIRDHGRYRKLKKFDNMMESLDEGIQMLKDVNDNFNY